MTAITFPAPSGCSTHLSDPSWKQVASSFAVLQPRSQQVRMLSPWDSFILRQGERLGQLTSFYVRTFLEDLRRESVREPDSAVAGEDGSLAMYWNAGDKKLEVEFEANHTWTLFYFDPIACPEGRLIEGSGYPDARDDFKPTFENLQGSPQLADIR